MKFTIAAVLAGLIATVSAQGVTISLPSGVSIPSGVTLPSGVVVVTASATSSAQANANNRFNKRQGAFSISGLSGISIPGLQQQTQANAAQATGRTNANAV